jgi:co-chaperonin GroES (HSP10)
MRISREELSKMVAMTNVIVVKPELLGVNEKKLENGIKLYLETSYSPEIWINVWGKVIKNPLSLFYHFPHENSLGWKTDIETKEGDYVLYNFVSAAQALGKLYNPLHESDDSRWFFCEEELYLFLRYDDIFLAKREDEIVMMNGFIMVEALDEEEVKSSIIKIPDHIRKKRSMLYGKVTNIGSRINEYYGYENYGDTFDVKKGDVICFEKFFNIELEVDAIRKLDKPYYRIHRKNIMAIVEQ